VTGIRLSVVGTSKGSGRIQFFHHFEKVSLRSTFKSGDNVYSRTLAPVAGRKKIDLDDFVIAAGDERAIGTTVTLTNLKHTTRQRFYAEDLTDTFSASNVRRHMLIAFLQRLVSLRTELGEFEIAFQTTYPDGSAEATSLRPADLPEVSHVRRVQVEERDPRTGESLGTSQAFKLSHYKLDAKQYDLPRNGISLCAKFENAARHRYLHQRGFGHHH
jgi:hypothetical protein